MDYNEIGCRGRPKEKHRTCSHSLFEDDRIEHSTQALHNIILHECVDFLL